MTVLGTRPDPLAGETTALTGTGGAATRRRGFSWLLLPLSIFAVTRIIDVVLVLVTARHQYAVALLPQEPGIPKPASGSSYLDVIANWDGQWYRVIAEHGYPTHLPFADGAVLRNPWAFYPLYPALVRAVMQTGLSYGAAASLVSLVCGAAAMCLLFRMLAPRCGRFAASLSVLALCTFPAAVTLQAAYTESLGLLEILAALWCLRERRYGALLGVALLLALTRPIVLPLALVAAVHGLSRWRRRRDDSFSRTEAVRLAVVVVLIGLSFLIWPLVAALVTGQRDAYMETQHAWTDQQHGWPSWLGVLLEGPHPVLVVVLMVTGLALAFVLLRAPARLWGLELRAWAAAYPLYVLASTLPASSIFRYAMPAIVPWWPFPEIGGVVTSRRGQVALAALVGALGIVFQYFYLRWFFVIGPDMVGHS